MESLINFAPGTSRAHVTLQSPTIMSAKKTAKKATKSAAKKAPAAKKAAKKAAVKAPAKKIAKPAVKKVAKKASKAVAKKPTTRKASAAPAYAEIQRLAFLNYCHRVDNGVPGNSHSDWLAAERQLGVS